MMPPAPMCSAPTKTPFPRNSSHTRTADADPAQQGRQQDRHAPAIPVGDPAHQVSAKQDAEPDLQGLDDRILIDGDDVARAPDERVEPGADAVGIEDDKPRSL